jgi:nucleotide-binding universal stress UspA family protein
MSASIRSVLVAVDFSEASAAAAAWGGLIARACGASLRLLHAEPPDAPPYFTQEQMAAFDRERAATRAQADRYLAQFGRQYTRHPFTTMIDDRTPVDAILKEAGTADLIVLGTHGRRGPTRWWMGSVAERLVRASPRPTLVVRAGGVPGSTERALSLLLDTSNPPTEQALLDYATALAEDLGAALVHSDGRQLAEAVAAEHPAMVIVPLTAGPGVWAGSHESLVRTCRVPVLFVPAPRRAEP